MGLLEVPGHVVQAVPQLIHVAQAITVPEHVLVLAQLVHLPQHGPNLGAGLFHGLAHLAELLLTPLLGHPLIGLPDLLHQLIAVLDLFAKPLLQLLLQLLLLLRVLLLRGLPTGAALGRSGAGHGGENCGGEYQGTSHRLCSSVGMGLPGVTAGRWVGLADRCGPWGERIATWQCS
ncbi:MAG TPA: hypothetical protein VLL51_04200 [Gemmatimonadales bacterium]|nr:hypothetical protein [Gemmatimonadales bacterium]